MAKLAVEHDKRGAELDLGKNISHAMLDVSVCGMLRRIHRCLQAVYKTYGGYAVLVMSYMLYVSHLSCLPTLTIHTTFSLRTSGTKIADDGNITADGALASLLSKRKATNKKYTHRAANDVRGVFKVGNRWKAQGGILGVRKHYIGTYQDKESAARAVAAYERGEEVPRPPRRTRVRSFNEFMGM